MHKYRHHHGLLFALAFLAGCAATPENDALSEARNLYNSARTDPQVVKLAPVELDSASDSLSRAESALSQGESGDVVEQLAYVAKQRVAIARETAKRKAAEERISEASAERDRVRLEARTAEVDVARQQATQAELSAQQQAERDQALIAQREAEIEAARQQAAAAEQAAQQQAAAAEQSAQQQAQALEAARLEAERAQARIAEQEEQLKALNAKKTDRGLVVTLGDVLFGVNKSELTPGGMRNVQKLAEFLRQYETRKLLIEGHTDSTGSDALNQALSERRAESVRTALVGMGIDGSRIATRGYGKAFPVASNNTAAGRQLNRRVEVVLSEDGGDVSERQPAQ
jgi:outer membrane protein OmpA-like peptidoglycan-associated protein